MVVTTKPKPKPKKCAFPTFVYDRVQKQCVCPDPKREFFAHIRDQRAKRGKTPLSAQELEDLYAKAVDRGEFVPPRELAAKCKPCGGIDVYKLYAWRLRRLGKATQNVHGLVEVKHARAKSAFVQRVGRNKQENVKENLVVRKPREHLLAALRKLRFHRPPPGVSVQKILQSVGKSMGLGLGAMMNCLLMGYLGGGTHGQVFSGLRGENKECAVKIALLSTTAQTVAFAREVESQRHFCAVLGPRAVPAVHGAWFVKVKTPVPGDPTAYLLYSVLVMDQIAGTVEDVAFALKEMPRAQAGLIARALVKDVRRIYEKLQRHKLVHGDLHLSNMGYRETPTGQPRVCLIDFGRSLDLGPASGSKNKNKSKSGSKNRNGSGSNTLLEFDLFMVWRSSLASNNRLLNDAMLAINFPRSRIMQRIVQQDGRPRAGTTTREQRDQIEATATSLLVELYKRKVALPEPPVPTVWSQ